MERFEGNGSGSRNEKAVPPDEAASKGREAGRGEDHPENLAHKGPEILRTEKTSSPSKTTVKEIKERMAKGLRLLNFVPKWFKERISCSSRDSKEIHEFWKVAKHLAKRTFGPLMGADEWQAVVSAAAREFYMAAKAATRGKFKMGNSFGFFHAVLEAEGYAHLRRRTQESSGLFYNWLED